MVVRLSLIIEKVKAIPSESFPLRLNHYYSCLSISLRFSLFFLPFVNATTIIFAFHHLYIIRSSFYVFISLPCFRPKQLMITGMIETIWDRKMPNRRIDKSRQEKENKMTPRNPRGPG